MHRHERRIYNLALRLTGNVEDARDATQDAFLAAYRKLPTFRGDAAFTTWLHRVAVNACFDLMRKRRRAPLASSSSIDDTAVETGPAVADHAEGTAAAIDVERALTSVPMEFRAPLVLHDVQDLSYDEIAAILEVPIGTVKSRIHRGRVALARALGREPRARGRASKEPR
jgi:RNA polymerase sigma-70 factor, ECF subfamily